MELLIFGHGGARTIVFPTRDGRFFDYENWRMVGAIADKIDAGFLQLVCVDSIDAESFYADWAEPPGRIARHARYERYILDEVLPFTETENPNPFVIAHGCSMGAFHAMNIGLRHPDKFGKIVALSGRYDLTISVGSFRDLFDGWYDESVYYHTPSHFVPGLPDGPTLDAVRRMEIFFAIGREDAFLGNNIAFSEALAEKSIPHRLDLWDGEAHRPRFWRTMLRAYL